MSTIQNCQIPNVATAWQMRLSNVFGVEFHFAIENDGWIDWKPAVADEAHDTVLPSPISWTPLDEVAAGNQSVVFSAGSDLQIVLIPLSHEYQTVMAIGVVRAAESEWLHRLAEMTREDFSRQSELTELNVVNDSLLTQFSINLEELTFLRQISDHLRVAEVNTDLGSISRQLLTLLNRTVQAEQIALLTEDKFAWIGEPTLDQHGCNTLVQNFGDRVHDQPLIVNDYVAGDSNELNTINNFIVAPLAKSGESLGWLIAINRISPTSSQTSQKEWQQFDSEFGTCEATLLASAAPMLVTHMLNANLFQEKERLLTEVVCSLVSAIEAKDKYTRGHSERVAQYGKHLAAKANLSAADQERIYLSGLLHDIGKIAISDQTLSKNASLTEAEFEEIQRHPEEGWAILQQVFQLTDILPGVLHHHERIDGAGYPDKLSGELIPVDGRILAVADAFDAMTSDRPYRKGMPVEKAVAILKSGAGTQWDAELIDQFLESLDEMVDIMQTYQPKSRPPRAKER